MTKAKTAKERKVLRELALDLREAAKRLEALIIDPVGAKEAPFNP